MTYFLAVVFVVETKIIVIVESGQLFYCSTKFDHAFDFAEKKTRKNLNIFVLSFSQVQSVSCLCTSHSNHNKTHKLLLRIGEREKTLQCSCSKQEKFYKIIAKGSACAKDNDCSIFSILLR